MKSSLPSAYNRSDIALHACNLQLLVRNNGGDNAFNLTMPGGIALPWGQRITLVGQSGSGKTTFLRMLAGLEWADAGSILWQIPSSNRDFNIDRKITKKDLHLVRSRYVAFVFQHTPLLGWLTVEEALQLRIAKARPCLNTEGRKNLLLKAKDYLGETLNPRENLGKILASYPSALSGGQKQRVSLVLALSSDPNVLLGDEIVSQLDKTTAGKVDTVLNEWLSEQPESRLIINSSHAKEVDDITTSSNVLKVVPGSPEDGYHIEMSPNIKTCCE